MMGDIFKKKNTVHYVETGFGKTSVMIPLMVMNYYIKFIHQNYKQIEYCTNSEHL